MKRLSRDGEKAAAVGLALLASALAWVLLVHPIVDGFEVRRTERETLANTLRRDQRLLAAFPRLREQAKALTVNAPLYAFQTGDVGAARGAAEALVSSAVWASGGVLHAVRVQSAPTGTLRLRAEAALTPLALVALLRRIEADRPYAIVEGLNAAVAPSAGPDAPMEVRFDIVYAYAAPGR